MLSQERQRQAAVRECREAGEPLPWFPEDQEMLLAMSDEEAIRWLKENVPTTSALPKGAVYWLWSQGVTFLRRPVSKYWKVFRPHFGVGYHQGLWVVR